MIYIPHHSSAPGAFSLFPFSLKLPNKEAKILRNPAVPKYRLEVRSSDTELRNLLITSKGSTNALSYKFWHYINYLIIPRLAGREANRIRKHIQFT